MSQPNFDRFDLTTIQYALDFQQSLDIGELKREGNRRTLKKIQRALKPIAVSSRKDKGRELQKWVCARIGEILGLSYNQQDDQCLIHSREMGQSGSDVILRGIALQGFPYTVECKNSESFNLLETIGQVEANQIPNTDWLIVHKRKKLKAPIIVLTWDAFEKLVKRV